MLSQLLPEELYTSVAAWGSVRIRHLSPRTNQVVRVNLYPPLGGLQRLLSLLLPLQVLDSSATSLLVARNPRTSNRWELTLVSVPLYSAACWGLFWNLPISSRCLVSRLFTCAIVDLHVYSLGINHRHLYSIQLFCGCQILQFMLLHVDNFSELVQSSDAIGQS